MNFKNNLEAFFEHFQVFIEILIASIGLQG